MSACSHAALTQQSPRRAAGKLRVPTHKATFSFRGPLGKSELSQPKPPDKRARTASDSKSFCVLRICATLANAVTSPHSAHVTSAKPPSTQKREHCWSAILQAGRRSELLCAPPPRRQTGICRHRPPAEDSQERNPLRTRLPRNRNRSDNTKLHGLILSYVPEKPLR